MRLQIYIYVLACLLVEPSMLCAGHKVMTRTGLFPDPMEQLS